MAKLDDRVAVVTGAARGNGEGIARALADHGARVALWDIDQKVRETADQINRSGAKATPFVVDVTDMEACQEAAFKRADDIYDKIIVATIAQIEGTEGG